MAISFPASRAWVMVPTRASWSSTPSCMNMQGSLTSLSNKTFPPSLKLAAISSSVYSKSRSALTVPRPPPQPADFTRRLNKHPPPPAPAEDHTIRNEPTGRGISGQSAHDVLSHILDDLSPV